MSTKAQAQRIINSERTFGQPVPFLLAPEQDGKFLLYDGHQRLSAWFTVYGAEHVMDAMVADRPLTEAEHKELIITLHTGATGSWNWETLGSWSAGDLQQWGMNADTLKAWILPRRRGVVGGLQCACAVSRRTSYVGLLLVCLRSYYLEKIA